MKTLTLDISGIYTAVTPESVKAWEAKSNQYQQQLHAGTGLGNDFLGWINLPTEISEEDLSAIEDAARDLQQRCDYVVSIGIGGSYLGARAVIEALIRQSTLPPKSSSLVTTSEKTTSASSSPSSRTSALVSSISLRVALRQSLP